MPTAMGYGPTMRTMRIAGAAALIGLGLGLGLVLLWSLGRPAAAAQPRPGAVLPGGAMVLWSPAYRVSFFGIERLHPFDVKKYDRIAAHLVRAGLVPPDGFGVGSEATTAQLAQVHDPAYLKQLQDPVVLSRALELPVPPVPHRWIDDRVLRPFRAAAGGTVAAAQAAREHGLAIQLGGGFHHARPALGHGFCVYNDIALAIHQLRAAGLAGRVLVVDTDAHQGDGTHAFFASDPSVFSLSLHQQEVFPHPKLRGDADFGLPAGTGDAAFLRTLDEALEVGLAAQPALIIHVAGADVLDDDPLAQLAMSPSGLMERDLRVLRAAREAQLPLVHLLAGGYGPSAAEAQAASVAAMLREVGGHLNGR